MAASKTSKKLKSYSYEIEYFTTPNPEFGSDGNCCIGDNVKCDDLSLMLDYVKNALFKIDEPVERYVRLIVWENFGKGREVLNLDLSNEPVFTGKSIYE